MSFTSFYFIIFIALVLFVYFATPKRYQWIVLLIASYIFFMICSKYLLLVHLLSVVITYVCAQLIYKRNLKNETILDEKANSLTKKEIKELKVQLKKKSKGIMWIGVFIVLGTLVFLKYYNFFAEYTNRILVIGDVQLPIFNLILPIGISFYTLQEISYIVDVQRGKYEPDSNIFKFMLFMSYFPQIVQGPIARYNKLAWQLYEGHKFDFRRLCFGSQLILWGFFKKLVIADRLAIPVDTLFSHANRYEGPILFLGAVFYGLQVYADFSSGMDIARGFSEIIGIELELNFEQPYFAKSIEEFWRRWHITLGAWMRDYVFYPLSLSKSFGKLGGFIRRHGMISLGNKFPSFLSMFIVYFFVGFWHGAKWTFIVYGVWNGIFIASSIILADTYKKMRSKCRIDEKSKDWILFQMIRTFIICSFGRIFSRAGDMHTAVYMFKSIFTKWYKLNIFADGRLSSLGLDKDNWYLVLIALVFMLFIDYLHERGVQIRKTLLEQSLIVRWCIIYFAIMAVVIWGVYGVGYDSATFIYAQF